MSRIPLKYVANPCDIDRWALLAPAGDALAALWERFTGDTDCPCCLGARLLAAAVGSAALGAGAALLAGVL